MPRERILMKNIAYAGALVAALEVDMEIVDAAAGREVRAARKPCANPTCSALRLGYDYAREHFACPLPFHLRNDGRERRQDSDRRQHGHRAGLRLRGRDRRGVVSHHAVHIRDGRVQGVLRKIPHAIRKPARNNYIIIQAEDELAAIGMVIGASWNGARASPPPPGPGISLMNELLGLAYYAEIPAVIIDVQRVGPSTGMPTRTQQGDLLSCAYASHGDTKHILLFPVQSGRVLRIRGEVVRSGGALPDAGVHAVGSGHRHERLGGAAPEVGRFVPPDRGRVLTEEDLKSIAEVLPLLRRR